MKAQSIIDEMKFDVQTKIATVHRLEANYRYHIGSVEKKWAKGSAGLFKSLIEYYGEVDGKRKWACVIRNKRMVLVRLKKKVAVARQELRVAKSVLNLAIQHL